MTRRAALATAAALALWPSTGAAIEWSGRAGLDYTRGDTWGESSHVAAPSLKLHLGLDTAGHVLRRDVLSWDAAISYLRDTASAEGQDIERDTLAYRFRSRLFTRASPLSLGFDAERSTNDFASDGVSGTARERSSSYGATARIALPTLPWVTAGYAHMALEQERPGAPESHRVLDTVQAATGHGDTAFSYRAAFRGTRSEGSFAADNFDEQRVEVDGSMRLAPRLDLALTTLYYVRTPTLDSEFNPRQELNTTSLAVTRDEDRSRSQRALYVYQHAVQETPAAPEIELANHRLAYVLTRAILESRWALHASADLSFSDTRQGDGRVSAAAETLSASLGWTRANQTSRFEVRAGPKIGLRHPMDGGSELGHGATASTIWVRGWDDVRGQLNYDVSYEVGLNAEGGWNFRQALSAIAEGPFRGGALRGQVTAAADRRRDTLTGDGAIRSLSALAQYRWGRYEGQLHASLQSSIGGTRIGGVSDGLFLPAGYDTHARFATLVLQSQLTRYLVVGSDLRLTSTALPDRPSVEEVATRGFLRLAYGSLTFAVEDRYVATSTPAGSLRYNEVFVRVFRSFGSRQ